MGNVLNSIIRTRQNLAIVGHVTLGYPGSLTLLLLLSLSLTHTHTLPFSLFHSPTLSLSLYHSADVKGDLLSGTTRAFAGKLVRFQREMFSEISKPAAPIHAVKYAAPIQHVWVPQA